MSAKKYDNNKKPSNGSFVVSCVGSGRKNDGCGYMGGKSGYQCPKCGGMLLSSKVIMDAKKLEKAWLKEEVLEYKIRRKK